MYLTVEVEVPVVMIEVEVGPLVTQVNFAAMLSDRFEVLAVVTVQTWTVPTSCLRLHRVDP